MTTFAIDTVSQGLPVLCEVENHSQDGLNARI